MCTRLLAVNYHVFACVFCSGVKGSIHWADVGADGTYPNIGALPSLPQTLMLSTLCSPERTMRVLELIAQRFTGPQYEGLCLSLNNARS